MIKQRQSWQAVDIEYSGSPILNFSVDGTQKITDLTLPTHANRLSRLITVPSGSIGYTPQARLSDNDVIRYSFRGEPVSAFSQRNIFAYYDVTFTGNIRVKILLDNVVSRPNDGLNLFWDISPRDGRVQDKRRVYFPPLSYGHIPHFEQDLSSGGSGVLIDYQLTALPSRYHSLERHHSEYQITYEGDVKVAIYLDGHKIVEEPLSEQIIPQDGGIKTYKGYFPSDSIGQVLQCIQVEGDGEIYSFETDQTKLDLEAPQVTAPA